MPSIVVLKMCHMPCPNSTRPSPPRAGKAAFLMEVGTQNLHKYSAGVITIITKCVLILEYKQLIFLPPT